jgi:putative NADH-flavin reductase
MLRKEKNLNWTFLSPSIILEPGKRTGKYRMGGDRVIFDDNNKSSISLEDYAVAMIDELENPKHTGKRFTVGY